MYFCSVHIFIAPDVAPSILELNRTNGTTIRVIWLPLTLGEARGILVGYIIFYEPINNRKRQVQSVRVPADSNEFTITGLDPTVDYSVSISAATAAGSGSASPAVAALGNVHAPTDLDKSHSFTKEGLL